MVEQERSPEKVFFLRPGAETSAKAKHVESILEPTLVAVCTFCEQSSHITHLLAPFLNNPLLTMDAIATTAASSDEAAPPCAPNKSPPESDSNSQRDSDSDSENSPVPEVSAKETEPTVKRLEEDDDRKCSYRDFSHVVPKTAQPSTRHKEPTFPLKLHMILSNPEFQHIIAWLPHGRAWRILQQKAFEQRVIPLFFRHGRYSSFARQVNGWGFMRITHGSDFGSYYHEVRAQALVSFDHKRETFLVVPYVGKSLSFAKYRNVQYLTIRVYTKPLTQNIQRIFQQYSMTVHTYCSVYI